MPVDFHFSGLPSRPGNVFGTGAWISGTGPRSGAGRGPLRASVGATFDETPVAADAATWVLVEGVAGAGESCAKRGRAQATAKPIKLTTRNGEFFIGGMVVSSRQMGQSIV